MQFYLAESKKNTGTESELSITAVAAFNTLGTGYFELGSKHKWKRQKKYQQGNCHQNKFQIRQEPAVINKSQHMNSCYAQQIKEKRQGRKHVLLDSGSFYSFYNRGENFCMRRKTDIL